MWNNSLNPKELVSWAKDWNIHQTSLNFATFGPPRDLLQANTNLKHTIGITSVDVNPVYTYQPGLH